MITEYIIPCSSCGKPVTRRVFCSGACRVRSTRDDKKQTIKIDEGLPVTDNYKPKIKSYKEIPKVITPKNVDFKFCKHGALIGLCKHHCEK